MMNRLKISYLVFVLLVGLYATHSNGNTVVPKKTFWQQLGFGNPKIKENGQFKVQQQQKDLAQPAALQLSQNGNKQVGIQNAAKSGLFSKIAQKFKKPERVIGKPSLQLLRNELLSVKDTAVHAQLSQKIQGLNKKISGNSHKSAQPDFVKEYDAIKKDIKSAQRVRSKEVQELNSQSQAIFNDIMKDRELLPDQKNILLGKLNKSLTISDKTIHELNLKSVNRDLNDMRFNNRVELIRNQIDKSKLDAEQSVTFIKEQNAKKLDNSDQFTGDDIDRAQLYADAYGMKSKRLSQQLDYARTIPDPVKRQIALDTVESNIKIYNEVIAKRKKGFEVLESDTSDARRQNNPDQITEM